MFENASDYTTPLSELCSDFDLQTESSCKWWDGLARLSEHVGHEESRTTLREREAEVVRLYLTLPQVADNV